MISRVFSRRSSSNFLVYSFWSSAKISSLPHPFLPPPLALLFPLAEPWVGFGMLNTLPRLLYWKFFLRCNVKLPPESVLHETRVKVGCPHEGQNCLDMSLHILKQPWHRRTQVLRYVMRDRPVSNRLGLSAGSCSPCKVYLLQVYPQSNVPHGHISGDQGCLEHTLCCLGRGVRIFLGLVLFDVAWRCDYLVSECTWRR